MKQSFSHYVRLSDSGVGPVRVAAALATFAIATFSLLPGCSSDSSPSPSGQGGSEKTNTRAPTSAATATDGNSPAKSAKSETPTCDAFYAKDGCCEELAGEVTAATAQCESAKKAIDDGLKAGATSAQFESTCKQAVAAAQKLGKCK